MNNFTAEKYISAILDRYIVGEKDKEKLQAGADLLNRTFGNYYWTDIEETIAWYYTNKNDKTRPTIAQLQAALSTRGVEKKPDTEPVQSTNGIPTTKIWSIKSTFNKLVQILIDGGVLPNADGEYHNIRSLVNPETNNVILSPMQWLKWQLTDAMHKRPDLFAKFPNATVLEGLAIAVQGGLVKFKVRDWAKLANKGE